MRRKLIKFHTLRFYFIGFLFEYQRFLMHSKPFPRELKYGNDVGLRTAMEIETTPLSTRTGSVRTYTNVPRFESEQEHSTRKNSPAK